MKSFFRFLAGLLCLLGLPFLAYGVLMAKAFGGFGADGRSWNAADSLELIVWVVILLALGVFSIFGRLSMFGKWKIGKDNKMSPDDPDYIFNPDQNKDENQSH